MSDLFKNAKMFVDDPMVHSNQMFNDALELVESGAYEKALSIFEQYRMYHPEDPEVYYQLANCHYFMENYDLGLELINRSLFYGGEYGEPYRLRGLLLIQKGDYANAIRNLEYCNVQIPNDEDTIFGLLQSYLEINALECALRCIRQILVINPLSENHKIYEAIIYGRLGQYDKAILIMEKLIANNPNEMGNIELLDLYKENKSKYEGCRYPGMNN
jgi:tetratricopeptide (TPR) repeat protein